MQLKEGAAWAKLNISFSEHPPTIEQFEPSLPCVLSVLCSFCAFVFDSLDHKELCSIHFFHCVPLHRKNLTNVSRDDIKWLQNIILLIFNLEAKFESEHNIYYTPILD